MEADLIAEGYKIQDATFTGPFGPEGEVLTFNGTVEDVVKQVLEVNPDYNFNATDTGIEARGWPDRRVARTDCNFRDFARGYWINEGIKYLRYLNGRWGLDAGECTRVSCSWNSAIWVCFHPDGSTKRFEKNWQYVADYADGIASGAWCPREEQPYDPFTQYLVRGKVWDPEGLSVSIRKDKC